MSAEVGEQADDYARVVVRIGDEHRVIVCKAGIQWIVQRMAGGRWRGERYHRSREGLLRAVATLPDAGDDVLATLSALPKWIEQPLTERVTA